MPISQNLRKFLIANGVDGPTAQKVSARIQHKAQQHTEVAMEELTLVHESIQRVPFSNFDRRMLQRLLEKSPQSTAEETGRLGMKTGRAGVKGLGDKIYKIPNPPAPMASKHKPTRAFVKSWNINGHADGSPLSPAMIRQLAYHIASS